MYRQYILGEDKYVELEIRCRQKDATVVIPEATWELFRASKDVPESTGSCEIDRQYIRALIEDLAAAAGTLGTMTALRRTRACGFSLADAVPLDEARRLAETDDLSALVRPVEGLFSVYPAVTVSAAQAARFANGGALDAARTSLRGKALPDGERLRVLGPDMRFLGLAETAGGELRVLRLFCGPAPADPGRKETQA